MKQMLSEKKYSPELVAAHWKRENMQGVSHETMYKFIWHCKHCRKQKNKNYKTLYKQKSMVKEGVNEAITKTPKD